MEIKRAVVVHLTETLEFYIFRFLPKSSYVFYLIYIFSLSECKIS